MRIGLVTGEFPPMEGGVGAFTEQLGRALATIGHEVHIITSTRAMPSNAPRKLSAAREPIELDYARLHPRIGRWRWPSLSAVADVVIRYDLEVVNLQYQAAAFNMRSPAINYLPWRLRSIAPTVVTFHDLRVPYLFPKAGGLREGVVRGLARRAQGSIATNPADLRLLMEWGSAPVRQIPIGSNINTYQPNHVEIAEARDGLGLATGNILLGYFGFLNETKGADILIDALGQLDDRFHLVLIGGQTGASDPDNNQSFLEQLRGQIDRAGLGRRVHWTGFLSPVRVSTFLAAADMMVMPYRDGVSLRRGTLMAVLAHGRPLITTLPAEPSPEFRHGNNMWLIPPNDVDELVRGIHSLVVDMGLRRRLGEEARDLARAYSWDAIAGQTAGFLAEVIATQSR
jgi:glycosyltransferase involved in cell wall biosynthesis